MKYGNEELQTGNQRAMNVRHTRTRTYSKSAAAIGLGTVVSALAVTQPAHADPPRFRLIAIKQLNFVPTVDSSSNAGNHGAMAINNLGEVVYAINVGTDVSPIFHPFIWLPSGRDSFTAGFHDLYEEAAGANQQTGIAHDINDAGLIVGQAGDGRRFSYTDQAGVWKLDAGDVVFFEAGVTGSGAEAINNDDPPIIVGYFPDESECWLSCVEPEEPPVDPLDLPRAFYAEFESDDWSALFALNPSAINQWYATGVGTVDQTEDFLVSGVSACEGCASSIPILCERTRQATYWEDSLPGLPDVYAGFSTAGSMTRGMSDDGHLVGCSKDYSAGPPVVCTRHAIYWESVAASLHDLSQYISGHAAWAEGVNSGANPWVVGWDEQDTKAILWEFDGSSWTATALTDDVQGCRWAILYAHDVNDSGWIAAVAQDLWNGGELHAVVLVPDDPCVGDLNFNNVVDTDDLLLVINGWDIDGCSNPPFDCEGDVNCNGFVDVDDLLEVINGWGDCELPEPNNMMQGGGGGSESQVGPEDVLEALEELPGVTQDMIETIQKLLEN